MTALHNREKLGPRRLSVYGFPKSNRRCVVQGIWGGEDGTLTGFFSDGRVKRNTLGLREKITLSSCNQRRCSKMKERLESHLLGHHMWKMPGTSKSQADQVAYTGMESQNTESKSPRPSKSSDSSSTQNDSNNNKDIPDDTNKDAQGEKKRKHKRKKMVEIPLRSTETQKLLAPKKNFYKQHLQDEVVKWFLKIPIFPSIDNDAEFLRLKIINNLVDNVADLSAMVKNESYDKEVRHEVEYCLDVILMKYTDSRMPKTEIKSRLCHSLLHKIEELNEKWLNVKKEHKKSCIATFDLITFPFDDSTDIEILRNEILDWIETKLKITCSGIRCDVHKNIICGIMINRLIPIIKSKINNKGVLQAEIKRILNDFAGIIDLPKKNRLNSLNTLAIDLTDRVTNMKVKNNYENNIKAYLDQRNENKDSVIMFHSSDNIIKLISPENESCSVELFNVPRLTDDSEEDTINQITEILFESIDTVMNGHGETTVEEICAVLKSSGEFSEGEANTLASSLVTNVKTSVNQDLNIGMGNPRSSGTMVILTSEQDLSGPFMNDQPLTSTPLLSVQKREVETLNSEEKVFIDKVAEVVTAWLDTTDMKFQTCGEQFFKMTIAKDIAGDVQNLAKLSQIQENMMMSNYECILGYIIMRAIQKYGLISTPVSFDTPQVVDLKERILKLGMLDMMMPQQGNRQNMANVKFRCCNPTREEFQPDALNVIEDNISVWMNEQPSEIYKDQDRTKRNKLLRDVATKIQQKMEKKKNEAEIKKVLAQWLKEIINSKHKKDVDKLAEELKERVLNLPQNETIRKTALKRGKALAGEDTDLEPEQYSNGLTDPDTQLKELIEKFTEHNFDVKDSLVQGAIGNILLQELLKLSPSLRKEACDTNNNEELNPDKFRKELEYIKEVSDWLKNIPFYPMLQSGNERIEFVNGLARNIAEIEEERIKYPGKMDYDLMLHSDIFEYMRQLPIPPQYLRDLEVCVNQLRERIARHRQPIPCCTTTQSQRNSPTIQNEQDLVNFIEEFVNTNSKDIGDDKLAMEAYLARLLKEIKKIVQEKGDVLTKAQVYDRLADVPLPGKESIKRFSIEMGYVKEIAEWLNNFPLITLKTQEDNEKRIRMISELSEKMIESDRKKTENPNDAQADAELDNYIVDWISQLDLVPGKEIVVPILITQLKKRMRKVNEDSERKQQPPPEVVADVNNTSIKKSKGQQEGQCIPGSSKSVSCCNTCHKPEDPGDLMVEAIESWCKDLPITEENEDSTKATKEKVAIDLFKKIGSLNDDPQIASDDLLFKEMLIDEVDAELQNLSVTYDEIKVKKDDLKESLLDKVMETKKVIKNISAGENYKEALENTIDASLPNPSVLNSTKNDPGFELYKHRMAMLWVLENYDYAVDFNSIRYKKKLMEDIEKYSDQAQKRNVFPMEKKEIFNEIFSALYKQNPPCEYAIIEEVENIKTRCEIDAWFKELPLKKACQFEELLERDQILAILAKRLFDIERSKDADADQKMQKEILKWLKRLPFLPDEDKNLTKYADKLICLLKATVDERKCIRQTFKTSVKQDKTKEKRKPSKIIEPPDSKQGNISQVAGPSGVKPQICCQVPAAPRKKAGDLITSAIETWCRELPLPARNCKEVDFANNIKDEAILKLYQLLSDLHADPQILNSEGLYEHHLQIEIERILSELPNYCEAQRARNARRAQLVGELKAVRPLIKDEMDREGYKQNLKHAITSFFDDEITTPKKIVVNDIAKSIMIDNFIEYSFHEGEFEDQQIFKNKMNDTMADVIKNNAEKADLDTLLTRNKLICKMTKVKQPKESALIDEVQEIRMKNEITELFKTLNIPEHDETRVTHAEQMKLLLTKKLIDTERAGHNCPNDQKMKTEIFKAIKKLGAEISPENVDAFVNRLKENEDARRALPPKKYDSCACAKNRHSYDQTQNHNNVSSGPSLVLRSPQQSFPGSNGSYSPCPQSPKMVAQSPRIPQSPCTPQSPRSTQSPRSSQSPTSPQSPRISQSPCTPQSPRSTQSPTSSQSPRIPQTPMPSRPPCCMPQNPEDAQCDGQGSPVSSFSGTTSQSSNIRPPVSTCQSSPAQNTSNINQSPSCDIACPLAAFKQPESNQLMGIIGNNLLNVPLEGSEQIASKTTARIQESPQAEPSEEWHWPDNPVNASTDTELDRLKECECTRNRKKKNCIGTCKADEPQYCDECENDHDCDYDVMCPIPIPGFVFF